MLIDFPHVTNVYFPTCSNLDYIDYSSKKYCKEREAGRRRVGSCAVSVHSTRNGG